MLDRPKHQMNWYARPRYTRKAMHALGIHRYGWALFQRTHKNLLKRQGGREQTWETHKGFRSSEVETLPVW